MENIVRLDPNQVARLRLATGRAQMEGMSLRVCTGVDSNGKWFKFDVGNTGWTEPLYGLEF